MKLKTGVIGLGFSQIVHLPEIHAHSGFVLVAVADTDKATLVKVCQQYPVRGYPDAFAMLEQEQLDLVVVASPHNFHVAHTVAALKRGCAVFLEKPMASTFQEALTIQAVQQQTGGKLMVYQPMRLFPESLAVKVLLDSGLLGKISLVRRTMSSFYQRGNWKAWQQQGGGTLSTHGAHHIDLLLYLTGGKANRVRCELSQVIGQGDADDCARIQIRTDQNMLLDIDLSMATAIRQNPWLICGTHGSAAYVETETGPVIRARYLDADHALVPQQYYPVTDIETSTQLPWQEKDFPIASGRGSSYYDLCYAYFVLDEVPFVPLDESLALMEILQRCRDSTAGWFSKGI